MHGGTNPGPPKGSQNALKHGRRSAAAIAERKANTAESRRIMRDLAAYDLAMKTEDGEELTPAETAEVLALFERLKARTCTG